MKRQALIIGAAYNDPQIPGVYTDLESWKDYLCSDIGGAWNSSEIVVLKDPNLKQVRDEIAKMEVAEFGFVVYCGHGYEAKGDKPWTQTMMDFGPHGELSDEDLNPGAPRSTLVMDCCRGVVDIQADRTFLVEGKSASYSQQRISSREAFDEAVGRAEKGFTKIYAASVDESASDERSFSKQLIHQSRKLLEVSKNVLTQQLAVELTAESMKKSHPQQHPEYKGGRRLNHFPFGVNV